VPPTPMPIPAGEYVPTADQRLVTFGVPWAHYEAQLALRGDASVPRMAYLEGALELMSPSKDHERVKSYIGCLVEAYALERGIEFSPYGAWTLKHAPKQAGAEPDQSRERPDLVIEVIWTTGGIDKLEIYRRLEISEVWFWEKGRLEVYVLQPDGYAHVAGSRLFPDLDLQLLSSFFDRPTVFQAVRAYRDALRPPASPS
jgi:Uma2 family endonuclease